MSTTAPDNDFPQLTEDDKRRMRVILEPLQSVMPTVPGEYIDRTGDTWTLNGDGTWTDQTGLTKGAEWNWLLAWNLPYTPAAIWDHLDDKTVTVA